MLWWRMLAALTALCACVLHACALPLFTTQFVLPENSESQPAVSQKVHAYIEDLTQRRALALGQNWPVQVALQETKMVLVSTDIYIFISDKTVVILSTLSTITCKAFVKCSLSFCFF